jgi:hypothetical protein
MFLFNSCDDSVSSLDEYDFFGDWRIENSYDDGINMDGKLLSITSLKFVQLNDTKYYGKFDSDSFTYTDTVYLHLDTLITRLNLSLISKDTIGGALLYDTKYASGKPKKREWCTFRAIRL